MKIYLAAANSLPSWTGLAPQCGGLPQAAAAEAVSPDASCPTSQQLPCNQTQLSPDQQTLQSGVPVDWPAPNSSADPLVWQVPQGSVTGRPATVQLSLESDEPPAFIFGPLLAVDMQTSDSFGIVFALDKPGLLVYGVFRPVPIDASGNPQAPVLIATGRVPVFDAYTNYTTGPITACSWAPGGPMQPASTYFLSYVARDRYNRNDGTCPGQAPSSQAPVCISLGFTA